MRVVTRALHRTIRTALLLWSSATACVSTRESTYELPELGRRYRVIVHRRHDSSKPAPVLVALHAYATPTGVLERSYDLERAAVKDRRWILVVPQGHTDARGQAFWNASLACCGVGPEKPDDVAYLRAVLRDVKARYAVEESKVFAIGVSNGGFMAHRWACEPGGDLRGIVSVSGVGALVTERRCRNSVPVSVLQVHGDADEVVQFAGGTMNAAHPSVRETVRAWCERAGYAPESQPRRLQNDTAFALPARVELWEGARARVALWVVLGGGHQLQPRPTFIRTMLDFLEHR